MNKPYEYDLTFSLFVFTHQKTLLQTSEADETSQHRQEPVRQVSSPLVEEQDEQEHNDLPARRVEGVEEDGWHEEEWRAGEAVLGMPTVLVQPDLLEGTSRYPPSSV